MLKKSEFLISGISTGKLNAMVKKIMAQTGITEPEEAVRAVNAGELQTHVKPKILVKPEWTEEEDVVHFSVVSDGTTGGEWVSRLKGKSFRISDRTKEILNSKDFKPTTGITYKIAILKGGLFSDNGRITENIRKEAKNRKLLTPNAEVACLIREKFSDKKLKNMGLSKLKNMGLSWIVTMHEPIKDSDGNPGLLFATRNDFGSWLLVGYDFPGNEWDRGDGFAFVVSQISNV